MLNLLQRLITQFCIPQTTILDNSPTFLGEEMSQFLSKYGIYWRTSSNYYPQRNGLDESKIKNLFQIIKRMIEGNQRQWHNKLDPTLWVDRISIKSAIKTYPYALVYVKRPI